MLGQDKALVASCNHGNPAPSRTCHWGQSCPHLGSGSRRVPCEGEAQGLFFQVCPRKLEPGQHELSTDVPGIPRARVLKAADFTLACVPRGLGLGGCCGVG